MMASLSPGGRDQVMGNSAQQTVTEIEETREDLARKVDLLVDQAKMEAKVMGKKLAIVGVALAGLLVVGLIAKKRVQ
jgi:tetrahydromethanopterin S-methyltransferase subunit F